MEISITLLKSKRVIFGLLCSFGVLVYLFLSYGTVLPLSRGYIGGVGEGNICKTICRCNPNKKWSGCKSVFVGYESSPFEKNWLAKITKLEKSSPGSLVCNEIVKEKDLFMKMYETTTMIESNLMGGKGASVDFKSLPGSIFSFMKYRWQCDSPMDARHGQEESVPIEPLVGLLRDARGICSGLVARDVGSRSMILLGPVRSEEDQIHIVDVGASSWSSGSGSTSQNWLVRNYVGVNASGYCLLSFHGFEADERYTFSSFAKELPADLIPVYSHFLIKASPVKGNALNPWSVVKELSGGKCAVKLDIDTPSVESPLIKQLLHDKELQDRIFEFFFEHHTGIWEMNRYWGYENQGMLSDTYKIFLQLRQLGIRAHAWP